MTLPGLSYRRTVDRARRHPLVWTARELSLTALSGPVGTLARTGTKAVADSYGTSRTVNHSQPAWYGGAAVPALDLGASESLAFACDAIPAATSGLLDFFENGSLVGADHLFSIGNNQPTATAPLVVVFGSGTQYQISHNNGVGAVSCTLSGTAPTSGQRVRLRWWLYSDGKVQIWQSINGAAETTATASATLALGANWSAPAKYWLNAYNSNYGAMHLVGAVVMQGNQSQATLLAALA